MPSHLRLTFRKVATAPHGLGDEHRLLLPRTMLLRVRLERHLKRRARVLSVLGLILLMGLGLQSPYADRVLRAGASEPQADWKAEDLFAAMEDSLQQQRRQRPEDQTPAAETEVSGSPSEAPEEVPSEPESEAVTPKEVGKQAQTPAQQDAGSEPAHEELSPEVLDEDLPLGPADTTVWMSLHMAPEDILYELAEFCKREEIELNTLRGISLSRETKDLVNDLDLEAELSQAQFVQLAQYLRSAGGRFSAGDFPDHVDRAILNLQLKPYVSTPGEQDTAKEE